MDTWILGVASKQLRLLHGRVGDSTTMVNSLSPQMSELVEDAVASCCGDIVEQFWLIRNELQKLVELKFEFFSFNTFGVSQIFSLHIIKYLICLFNGSDEIRTENASPFLDIVANTSLTQTLFVKLNKWGVLMCTNEN